jgi:hypothetical protein
VFFLPYIALIVVLTECQGYYSNQSFPNQQRWREICVNTLWTGAIKMLEAVFTVPGQMCSCHTSGVPRSSGSNGVQAADQCDEGRSPRWMSPSHRCFPKASMWCPGVATIVELHCWVKNMVPLPHPHWGYKLVRNKLTVLSNWNMGSCYWKDHLPRVDKYTPLTLSKFWERAMMAQVLVKAKFLRLSLCTHFASSQGRS